MPEQAALNPLEKMRRCKGCIYLLFDQRPLARQSRHHEGLPRVVTITLQQSDNECDSARLGGQRATANVEAYHWRAQSRRVRGKVEGMVTQQLVGN